MCPYVKTAFFSLFVPLHLFWGVCLPRLRHLAVGSPHLGAKPYFHRIHSRDCCQLITRGPCLSRSLSPSARPRTHFLPSFKMACLPQPQRVTYVAGGWRAVLLNLLLLRKTVHHQKHCPWMRPRKRAGLLTVCIHVLHHQACVCRRHRPTLVSQHVHKLTGRTIAATAVCADDRHGFFWGRLLVLCCARVANRSPA